MSAVEEHLLEFNDHRAVLESMSKTRPSHCDPFTASSAVAVDGDNINETGNPGRLLLAIVVFPWP